MVPHSLSSLDAGVALFPSCGPQISFLRNCSQPPSREEGWGEVSRRGVLVPAQGHRPAVGGKAQTVRLQNYVCFPRTSEATHTNYAY